MGRDLKLWKYEISKERYRYLNCFCKLYPQWKKYGSYGLSAVVNDGMPHARTVGSPTEAQAIRNSKFMSNIKLIEDTCKEADEEIWVYILKNVTEGVTYEMMDVPRGRSQFYSSRRRFFYMLDLKLP